MSNNKLLSWTSHPFKEYPTMSLLLSIFMILLAIGLWYLAVDVWEMPIFYYIGLFAFFFSLITYFIPTKYNIYNTKIEIYYWFIKVERSFADFGCYYSDKKGVMLSTFKRPRKLDPFRGLSLRFSRNKQEKEELMKILQEKIGNKY